MATIKKNSSVRPSTKSSKKGDPAKADMDLIQEHSAELMLKALANDPGEPKTKLGPNELAWQAQQRAERAAAQAKADKLAHKGKRAVHVVTCVTLDRDSREYGVGTIDTYVATSKDEAVGHLASELAEIASCKVSIPASGKLHKVTKKSYVEVNLNDGVCNDSIGLRGCVVAKCETADGLNFIFTIDEKWISKK